MTSKAQDKDQIRAEVLEMILSVLKQVLKNQGKPIPALSPETTLYGQGSDVDSLGFVQLLLDVEERVNTRYAVSVTPTDEKAMSQRNSPFRTVQTLAEYLADLIVQAQIEAPNPGGPRG